MKGASVRRLCAAVVAVVGVAGLAGAAAADHSAVHVDDSSGSEASGQLTFTVRLDSAAPAGGTTLNYTTTPGTASAADYNISPGVVVVDEGQTTKTFEIAVVNDPVDEGNEAFGVTVTGAAGSDTATGTITDDDGPPAVSISDASTSEGSPASFTVSLAAASALPVTVDYQTQNGTATAPADYQSRSGTVTFDPGDREETITVQTAEDTLDENNETFSVQLSDNSNIADGEGVGTIADDDDPASILSIGDTSVAEGNSGNVNATFVVTLAPASGKAVTVQYSTAEGTAAAGDDFTAESGTVTFPPGVTSRTIDIPVKGDTLPEPDEHFFVNLFGAVNAASISDAQGRATITNDDAPPTVTSIGDATVTEGNAGSVTASFEVTLSAAAPSQVTIGYATQDGTATAPSDYTQENQTLTIPAGSNRGTISIEVKGDTLAEPTEDFFVNLLAATNATLGSDRQGKGTIANDDAPPTVSISNAQVTEGDGATVNLNFIVRMSARSAQRVEVTASTQDGSAVAPGDYQVKTQVLVWAPNTDDLEHTFSVAVNGDAVDEPSETMRVNLTGASRATAGGSATGTIQDNDNRSMLGVSNAEANEGAAGVNGAMTFKVTLAPVSARAVTVAWGTANGTATAGSDYTAASGTVTFAPGETEKSVTVPVLGDDVNEENETVFVNLSGASGAGVADAQGLGTIVDKNAPPSLSINDPFARESEGATFTITLAGTTLRTVTVTFSTADGSAREGTDYSPRRGTLTFAPGEKTKTVMVTVLDDPAPEGMETFSVNLGDAVNGVITKSRGVASIEASDQGATGTAGTNTPPRTNSTPLPVAEPKTNTPTVFPRMVLGPRALTLTSVGRAVMRITCAKRSKVHCVGTVALESLGKPRLVLAQRAFAIKKGRQGSVPLRLSDRGFALVQKRGSVSLRAVVYLKAGGKRYRIVPGSVLVRATKKPEPRVQASP